MEIKKLIKINASVNEMGIDTYIEEEFVDMSNTIFHLTIDVHSSSFEVAITPKELYALQNCLYQLLELLHREMEAEREA